MIKLFGKLICVATSLWLAAPVIAQSNQSDLEEFLEIIAQNGCFMTEAEAESIFPTHGFDKERTQAAARVLIASGAVVFENGSLGIAGGNCVAGDGASSDLLDDPNVQQFFEIMALNRCVVSENQVGTVFSMAGMDASLAVVVSESLIEAGYARLSANAELVVDMPLCFPALEVLAPAVIYGFWADPVVQQFMVMMADNNCQLGADEAIATLAAAGIEEDAGFRISEYIVDQGYGVLTPEDVLLISQDHCSSNVTPEQASNDSSVDDNMTLLLSIMETQGCRIESGFSHEVFSAGGLDPNVGVALAMELVADGLASIDDSAALVFNPPICGADGLESAVTPDVPMFDLVPGDYDTFFNIMAQNGCEMTELEARDLFPAAGLSMEAVYMISDQLVAQDDGYFSDDDTTLTITSLMCIGNDNMADSQSSDIDMPDVSMENDPEAQFLMLMAANDCTLSQTDARNMTSAAGMDFNLAMGVAANMLNDGRATTPDGGQTLHIAAPLCVSGASLGSMEPRDIFIEVLRDNNCTLTAGEFGSILPVAGLDQNTAFGLITDLEAEGVITLPPSRDIVTLTAENCR